MKLSLSIQYLRAVAATMVVVYHVALHWFVDDQVRYCALAAGVDIFFVISGFIMWTSTGPEVTPRQFAWRRIRRIVPLYWLVTIFMVAVMVLVPAAMLNSHFDLAHVIKSFLFIPTIHPVTGLWEPVVFAGWTLNYEMFFYAIFAVTLFAPRAWRAGLLALALLACVAAGLIPHKPASLLSFYGSSILLEFLAGVGLAILYQRGGGLNRFLALAMVIAGAVGMYAAQSFATGPTPRFLLWGVPAFLIVSGAIYLERAGAVPESRGFKLLGDASYSIYLVHVIAVSALFQLMRHLPWTGPVALVVEFAIVTVCAVALGVASYLLVERPISQRLGRPRPIGLAAPGETRQSTAN